jgi:integrase
MKTKLTKTAVEKIQPEPRDFIVWDTEINGFGCKITPKGKRVYFLYYRTTAGRERRPSIGVHGQLTCQEAREIASRWRSEVARGGDPSEARRDQRSAETLAEFSERYMTDYAPTRKRASSITTDRINLRCHILPALGNLKLADITRADVIRLHQSMSAIPGGANRTLALVSHMLNIAEKWGLRPDGSNPCRHVEKFPANKRQRFLSETEIARLADTLAQADHERTELPSVIAAIRLLIFTGARLSEILTLRWEHVDLDNQRIVLPQSKTGKKIVYLSQPAIEVLSSIEQTSQYVIQGRKPGAHLVNLEKPWRRIRARVGLDDVRLHDLRHSFASIAAGLGEGLPMIGRLLGHTQAATTHQYAHLADDPVRTANERIGAAISGMMRGKGVDVDRRQS